VASNLTKPSVTVHPEALANGTGIGHMSSSVIHPLTDAGQYICDSPPMLLFFAPEMLAWHLYLMLGHRKRVSHRPQMNSHQF
jgi:hypothetical protein